MKFLVKKTDILNALSMIQGIGSYKIQKGDIADSKNILIKSFDQKISLCATNLEIYFKGEYPAKVEKEGTILVNSKKLFEIVRDFPEKDIFFENENNILKICNNKIDYQILSIDPDQFPLFPRFDNLLFFKVDNFKFKNLIEKAKSIGVSNPADETRANMLGICIERIDNNTIRVLSTDIKRLLKVEYKSDEKIPKFPSKLIPKSSLGEVLKFVASGKEIQIAIEKEHFLLNNPNETMIIKALDGKFIEYESLIKFDEKKDIKIDKEKFFMMLKRMSILTSELYQKAFFKFADNEIVVHTTHPDFGESTESMEISFDRETIHTAFNLKYFLSILPLISTDEIIINLRDERSLCLVRTNDEDNLLVIITQMQDK